MDFIGNLFYGTDTFLSKVTEENYSKPEKLDTCPHYMAYFLLFKYKTMINRDVFYVPKLHCDEFSKTKHADNFHSNVILSNTIEEDRTFLNSNGMTPEQVLAESATYKSGEEANFEVNIIACEDEYDKIMGVLKKHSYPIEVYTPKKAIERIKFLIEHWNDLACKGKLDNS